LRALEGDGELARNGGVDADIDTDHIERMPDVD